MFFQKIKIDMKNTYYDLDFVDFKNENEDNNVQWLSPTINLFKNK